MAAKVQVEVELLNRLTKEYKRVQGSLSKSDQKIIASLKKVRAQSKKTNKSILSNLSAVKIASVALAGFIGGRLVGAFVKAGSEVQDFAVQFEVLLGSADAADKRIKELAKFAESTPFKLADLAEAEKLMLSFGLSADKTTGYLRQLGDVSLGDSEKLKRLALAFSQIQGTGRLMGQDLLQLINAGFNPLQIISEKTGETMLQLKKRMEAGGISAAEVAETFDIATSKGGRFESGMEKMSKTVTGLSSTISDQLSAAMRQMLASGVWDSLQSALKSVAGTMTEMLKNGTFERWGKGLMGLVEAAGMFVKGIMKIRELLHGPDSIGDDNFLTDPNVTAKVQKNIDKLIALQDTIVNLKSENDKFNAAQRFYNKDAIKASGKLFTALEQEKKLRAETAAITGVELPKEIRLLEEKSAALSKHIEKTKVLAKEVTKTVTEDSPKVKGLTDEQKKAAEDIRKANIKLFQEGQDHGTVAAKKAAERRFEEAEGRKKDLEDAKKVQEELVLMQLSGDALKIEKIKRFQEEKSAILEEAGLSTVELEKITADQIDKVQQNALDREKARSKTKKDIMLQASSSFAQNLQTMAGANKKYGAIFKAGAIAETTISTYQSAQKMFAAGASFPFPANVVMPWVLSASAVGAGLANIAAIKSQKFAQGGVVEGNSFTGDNVPIRANSGEVIFNKKQFKDLTSGRMTGGNNITFEAPQITVNGGGNIGAIQSAVAETYEEMIAKTSEILNDAKLQEQVAQ